MGGLFSRELRRGLLYDGDGWPGAVRTVLCVLVTRHRRMLESSGEGLGVSNLCGICNSED